MIPWGKENRNKEQGPENLEHDANNFQKPSPEKQFILLFQRQGPIGHDMAPNYYTGWVEEKRRTYKPSHTVFAGSPVYGLPPSKVSHLNLQFLFK